MNYAASKNPVNPVTNDTPGALSALQSSITSRTRSDTPFLLMPVRLETRFMKVMRNVMEDVLTANVDVVVTEVKNLLTEADKAHVYGGFTNQSAFQVASDLKSSVASLTDSLEAISVLQPLERSELMRQVDSLSSAIGVAFGNLSHFITDQESVNLLNNQITPAIQSDLAALSSSIDSIQEDPTWQEGTTTSGSTLLGQIENAIDHNAPLVDRATNRDGVDYTILDALVANFQSAADALSTGDANYSLTDKQHVWQVISDLQGQLEQVVNSVDMVASQGIPAIKAQSDLYWLEQRLSVAWKNFMMQGLAEFNWLTPPSRIISLSDDDSTNFPTDIIGTHDTLNARHENIQNIIDQLPGESDFNPGYFNMVFDQIDSTTQEFAKLDAPQDESEVQYLWQALSGINMQLPQLQSFLTAYAAAGQPDAATYLASLQEKAFTLAQGWSAFSGISSAGAATLFSPWQKVDELWIRVYPDDIFIHSHEEALTQSEKDAGTAYWNEWWAAQGNVDKQLAAWKALVALYGPERAAWIIKVLTPTNLANVVIISTTTSVLSQVNILNTYTNQLLSISSTPSQSSAMPQFLSYYSPKIGAIQRSLQEITAIPEDLATITLGSLSTTQENFETLGQTVLQENEENLELQETINGISAGLQTLSSTINNINFISSWDELYSQTPVYPTVTIKADNWTEPSRSFVLPERFVFATVNNVPGNHISSWTFSFRHIKVGKEVPHGLQVGLHPSQSSFNIDQYHNLILDPNLKWMFDFGEAINKGMGIIIRLTTAEATAGFDRLLALGVKVSDTTTSLPLGYSNFEDYVRKNGKQLLEQLMNNHHYTAGGLSLLTLGTATNNTDNNDAGYNQADAFAMQSFAVEVQNPLFAATTNKLAKKDGQWLADALGVDYSVFQHIRNADKRQISGAIAMNRALWPATIGNFMSEILSRLFTADNIQRTKSYFSDYVLGRGALPPIRVGNQPYGILPTTAFSRWSWTKKFVGDPPTLEGVLDTDMYTNYLGSNVGNFYEDRFNERLLNVLETLNNTWLEIVDKHVKTVERNKGTLSTQQDFMEILGSDALMAEAYSRFMLNTATFTNIANYYTANPSIDWPSKPVNVPSEFLTLFSSFNWPSLTTGPSYGLFDDISFTSLAPDANSLARGIMKALPILNVELLKEDANNNSRGRYLIGGPTVDEKLLSERDSITPIAGVNYIQYLLNAQLSTIWLDNRFGNMQSRSLLFLLLRQSLLMSYRDTAWDTLVNAGVFSRAAQRAIGSPAGAAAQILHNNQQFILTKWHLLFEKIATLDSNANIKEALRFFSEDAVWGTPSQPSISNQGPDFRNIVLGNFLKTPQGYASSTGYNTLINHTDFTNLNTVRDAFDNIKFLPTADLDRLLREHIDLASYRLDAWNTGMVNKRLWEHRAVETGPRKTGIYLGAYGWLLDIRPKNLEGLKPIKPGHLPTHLHDTSDPVYYDKQNLGFIHTPSIAHSLTAAILRSGFISEQKSADNRFAVNLSSERVKLALSLFEGIRNGQTLNAMLGYMFERNLHERYQALPLDQFIYTFRRQFPLGGTVPSTATPIQDIRPNNVVDGVELLHQVRTSVQVYTDAYPDRSIYDLYTNTSLTVGSTAMNSAYPFGLTGLPPNGSPELLAIITEIDRLANAVDAVGDLAIAEGVFQVAKGNFSRSAAMIESLTEGKNPADPEIIDTPTTGTHLDHRVVAMVEPVTGTISSPWSNIPLTPRANAEPSLNTWVATTLASIFPSSAMASPAAFATHIGCRVSYNDVDEQEQDMVVLLSDLAIQPIDLVYLVQAGGFADELSRRIAQYVRVHASDYDPPVIGIPAAVQIHVHLKEKGNTSLLASFWDILTVVNAISGIILNCRWLKADDFVQSPNPQINTAQPLYNLAELQSRATTLRGDFHTYINDYFNPTSTSPNPLPATVTTDTELTMLRSKLLLATNYGVDFAIPVSHFETFQNTTSPEIDELAAAMVTLAHQVGIEVNKRYNESGNLLNQITNTSTAEEKVKIYTEVIKTLLGGGFKALPHFSFNFFTNLKASVDSLLTTNTTTNSAGIMRQYQPSNVVAALDDWLYSLSRVQESLENVETIRMLADDANSHPLKAIRPVQFPYVAASTNTTEDYWLGLPYPGTYTPSGDKLSIAIFNYAALGVTSYGYYAGLVIDEWSELIPVNEVLTGITYHYDQPNAKPPQSVLLAISPGTASTWTLDDLWYTLLNTMEMAKIRMVEPDHFKFKIGDSDTAKFEIFKWLLPAVVGEVTPHDIDSQGQHVRYQGADSVQQVSFEYNPNNDAVPTPSVTNVGGGGPIGIGNPDAVMVGIDWDSVDSDFLVSNDDLQQFSAMQYTLGEIAVTQGQMAEDI